MIYQMPIKAPVVFLLMFSDFSTCQSCRLLD
jgi:hypothetical protein